jgi:hypothetical protein
MNAVNDTCELTEAELDLVAGGAPPPHYEFGTGYNDVNLLIDAAVTFEPWIKW